MAVQYRFLIQISPMSRSTKTTILKTSEVGREIKKFLRDFELNIVITVIVLFFCNTCKGVYIYFCYDVIERMCIL